MYKIYLLSFDPHKTNPEVIHEIIKKSKYVSNWWHYLGSTYLIKSKYTLNTLQNEIITHWPNQYFLLIEVDVRNVNGWLPKLAWDWINVHR